MEAITINTDCGFLFYWVPCKCKCGGPCHFPCGFLLCYNPLLAKVVLSSRQVFEHSSIVAWCRRILLILCILAVAFVVTPVINAPHRNPQIYQFSDKCRHRRHKLVPSISFERSIVDFLGKRGGAQYFKIFSLPLFCNSIEIWLQSCLGPSALPLEEGVLKSWLHYWSSQELRTIIFRSSSALREST